MKKHKKKIIFGLIIVIIIGFIWQRYFRDSNEDEAEIFMVEKGDVEKTLSVSGNLKPKKYADLSFEMPALVSWVGVEIGDKVESGQALVRLDKSSLAANVSEATVGVETAIEAEKLARRKWDDYKPEEREQIKKNVEQSRHRLNSVRAQLHKGTLTSPIDGIVTKLDVRKGELAQGVVARIINEEKSFEVEAFVSEADVIELYNNQKAQITFDALSSEDKFVAKIIQIDPEAVNVQDVVYFRVLFELDNIDERVRSGMTTDIDILVSERDSVNVIPLRFIRRDDEGSYVFIQVSGESEESHEKRYIKTGVEGDDGMVEILEGLNEGENVYLIYGEEE